MELHTKVIFCPAIIASVSKIANIDEKHPTIETKVSKIIPIFVFGSIVAIITALNMPKVAKNASVQNINLNISGMIADITAKRPKEIWNRQKSLVVSFPESYRQQITIILIE